jgi:thiol-disulfide isomerase/thioredoxin
MKTVLLVYLCVFINLASAQTPRPRLTESSVVKDAEGTIYPYDITRALLMKGSYTLKTSGNDTFLLVKLSESERLARLEKMPKPKESPFFKTGEKIKLPNTTDIEGNKLRLKESTGKIVVLNFWFINCPPCRTEIPDLNELVNSYQGNENIQFVAVALDAKSNLVAFLKQMPFNYQIIDDGRFMADKFGIRSYPTHVILDTEGKVYYHSTGLATNTVYWLKKSIDELIRQKAQP